RASSEFEDSRTYNSLRVPLEARKTPINFIYTSHRNNCSFWGGGLRRMKFGKAALLGETLPQYGQAFLREQGGLLMAPVRTSLCSRIPLWCASAPCRCFVSLWQFFPQGVLP